MPFHLRHGVQQVNADGSPMLFNTRTGHYFTLNASAATALALLIRHGEEEAATALTAAYGTTRDRAAHDVRAMIAGLTGLRLLERR
ncbi:PqqD family peptide modification chaperone [Streptomyces gamaensis]|uniref:PqqD family peptide modification chaperone n=1 Tax=Streptomyces gamaensis TaxID=1763542 RepID=A0ABW0Z6U4_9ACTN